MVLEIRISNFFSIDSEVVLDLRAASINTAITKSLENNVFQLDKNAVLKVIAMYGANASGKSNIIKAIRFCNAMIYESHRHNENTLFKFSPFKLSNSKNKPSQYFIRFVSHGIEYEYAFSLTQYEIIEESLFYYPRGRIAKIFTRDERLGKSKKNKYSFGSVIKRPMDVATNTSNKTLFISRASQMDRDIGKEIFSYFNHAFILGYQGFNAPTIENLFKINKQSLLTALKIADSDIADIKMKIIKSEGKNYSANLSDLTLSVEEVIQENLKITTYHQSKPDVPFDLSEESAGTQKLFFIMLTIIDIVRNNKILLIDEIDESLHTDIIEYIFNLFNAGECAQLICTTHNTYFLDLKKFRKDQIYFVNKVEDGSTDLYSLYDYSDFRDTMALEKAYLQGRFDAIPFVDDSDKNLKEVING